MAEQIRYVCCACARQSADVADQDELEGYLLPTGWQVTAGHPVCPACAATKWKVYESRRLVSGMGRSVPPLNFDEFWAEFLVADTTVTFENGRVFLAANKHPLPDPVGRSLQWHQQALLRTLAGLDAA
jgi:hypothetical protein